MRRYKPEAYTEYDYGSEYQCVRMEENRYGEWVPFENAKDTVRHLTKQIERLKMENKKLKALQS